METSRWNTIRVTPPEKKLSLRGFFCRKQFYFISVLSLVIIVYVAKSGLVSKPTFTLFFILCAVVSFLAYWYPFYSPSKLFFHSNRLIINKYGIYEEIKWEDVQSIDFLSISSVTPKMEVTINYKGGVEILHMENDIIDRTVSAKMNKFVMLLAFHKKSRELLMRKPIGEV